MLKIYKSTHQCFIFAFIDKKKEIRNHIATYLVTMV